jgi:putative transposase
MVTPAAKREAVAHLRSAFEMSERRACRVTGCERMTMRYRSRRPDDQALRERLRALAHERRRFGYRRLHVFLKREGYAVNHRRPCERLLRCGSGSLCDTRGGAPVQLALWSLKSPALAQISFCHVPR